RELMNDPAVVNAYLGGGAAAAEPTAKRPIRLPRPFLLPGTLAAIRRHIGALAARASAIQAAFVQYLRGDNPLPSAFAGRYDPARMGDPWAELVRNAPTAHIDLPPAVSIEGKQLSRQAAALANAAAERHARHIRSLRPATPRHSPVTA